MTHLEDVRTPALLLDRRVLEHNVERMAARMRRHGVALRPHLKTAKCAEVAALATAGQPGGITVSTLAEAAFFAARGFRDLLYAVEMVPSKLDAIAALQRDGARVAILVDDADIARAVAARAGELGLKLHTLIEIDTGGGRGGVAPRSDELLEIATVVREAPDLVLDGVLTHAGHSYHCTSIADVERVAEEERAGVVGAAERLRAARFPCSVVSAGSTPTAVHAASLDGVTEMRPGNYVFFDLAQMGLGSCELQDIAVSVLATVIGRHRDGRLLVDAGSLALSADRSANERLPGVGYGIVLDASAEPFPGRTPRSLRVARLNQEHGFLEAHPPLASDQLPVGTRVRIFPNHACITAAMFDTYHVVDGGEEIVATWTRARGW
jgi:D-serine deaminase-like pyridoxal phosphate-dependent protein